MDKILIKRVGVEQTVTFDIDSEIEVTAEIIVHAHTEDFGIGPYEHHGYRGVHKDIGWVIDDIEIIKADVYVPELDDFARLQPTAYETLKHAMINRIEILETPDEYNFPDDE
jgi:hypothetical protein